MEIADGGWPSSHIWNSCVMTRLGAEFVVEIDGIVTSRDALGRSITLEQDRQVWRIDIPDEPNAFPFIRASLANSNDPRDYAPVALVDTGSVVEVRLLRIVANIDADLSAETFDAARDADEYRQLLHTSRDKALSLAAELMSRMRLEVGQYWVEPQGRFPKLVGPLALYDIDANRAFPMSIMAAGSVLFIDPATALSQEALARLESSMASGRLESEEVLLSESQYLAESGQGGAADRATLLAAIAVELRTKRVLRELAAKQDRVAELELLLENPRDWSMSAHGLYQKALPVFVGESGSAASGSHSSHLGLGEEHRRSARDVQRLFDARNAIAHRGRAMTVDDGKTHVATAVESFRILRAVLSQDVAGSDS